MHRMTVLYGRPEDPAAFDRHYREVHIPLAGKMPGLDGWTIGKVIDPDSPYYLIATLYTADKSTMDAMLASPEGQAARADVEQFATGGVTVLVSDEEVVVSIVLGGFGG